MLFKLDENGGAMAIDMAEMGKTTEAPRFDGWTIDRFRLVAVTSLREVRL